jgi:hypothetical protein
MKTFQELREKKSPSGKVVFDKKIDKVPVKITQDNKGFTVYIDGDMLDVFKSKAEAEKTAKTVIKELK